MVPEMHAVDGQTASPRTSPKAVQALAFTSSPEPLLGVELELMLLDRDTRDLAPGAVRILKACEEEAVEGVTAEFMQSMLEVKTSVCKNVEEARQQLLPRLRRVRHIASSLGYDIAFAGTHPFHRTSGSVVFPDERYEKISDRLAWITYQRVVFGLHVHVGVPNGELALGTINYLIQYLPHLLALSASSPFWQGIDTGLASTRAVLYRMLPHSGVPRFFGTWKEFCTYCNVMIDCKAMRSFKDIYWDIRPRPDLGTIEFRICDMPCSLSVALGLVALTQCLTIHALRLLQEKPKLIRGNLRRNWIAGENKWLATRYGLDAMFVRTPGGRRRKLAHDLKDLLGKLKPIAAETGGQEFLSVFQPTDSFETGAAQQRRMYREKGDWKAVVEALIQQLGNELTPAKEPYQG